MKQCLRFRWLAPAPKQELLNRRRGSGGVGRPPAPRPPSRGGQGTPPGARDPKRPPPGGVGSRPSIFQEKNRGLLIDEKFLVSARIFLLSFFFITKKFSIKIFCDENKFFLLEKKFFFPKKSEKTQKSRKNAIFGGFRKTAPCHEFRVGGAVF